jgi:hypothetical protein
MQVASGSKLLFQAHTVAWPAVDGLFANQAAYCPRVTSVASMLNLSAVGIEAATQRDPAPSLQQVSRGWQARQPSWPPSFLGAVVPPDGGALPLLAVTPPLVVAAPVPAEVLLVAGVPPIRPPEAGDEPANAEVPAAPGRTDPPTGWLEVVPVAPATVRVPERPPSPVRPPRVMTPAEPVVDAGAPPMVAVEPPLPATGSR